MPKARRRTSSRDRVFACLDFQTPDRVPTDFWASTGFWAALRRETGQDAEQFLDRWDVDFRYIEGPRYIGPPLRSTPEGLEPDIWGVPRRAVRVPTPYGEETYHEVAAHPLASARTPEEIDSFPGWPSADDYDYSVIAAQCARVRDAGRVAVFMGDRLNRIAQLKPAMYLRGIEQIMVDMAESPEVADAVFVRIRRFYSEYLRRILEAARGAMKRFLQYAGAPSADQPDLTDCTYGWIDIDALDSKKKGVYELLDSIIKTVLPDTAYSFRVYSSVTLNRTGRELRNHGAVLIECNGDIIIGIDDSSLDYQALQKPIKRILHELGHKVTGAGDYTREHADFGYGLAATFLLRMLSPDTK